MFYLALILLKLLAFALSLLPRPLFLLMGRGLGRLLAGFHFRERVAAANLELAFAEKDPASRAELLRSQYAELGVLFLEMLRSFYRFDRFVERNSDVEGEEHLRAALAQGKGIFVMTAHLGNWEVLTASGPTLFGTGVTMVTKELKPKWFHRVVEVTRSLLGVQMACEPRTMQGILRALKRKEIVGFVMDQYAGAPVGARVPFFGKAVGSHTALATLALRTGAPVVPAVSVRKPGGRYLIRFEPPFPLEERSDPQASVIANTALFVRHTEKWVREFPEQWMWIHRRWKGDLSPLPPQVEGEMLS
jgi:Kdo2-lipid IVA lauroyltransferase/acyltransferase